MSFTKVTVLCTEHLLIFLFYNEFYVTFSLITKDRTSNISCYYGSLNLEKLLESTK